MATERDCMVCAGSGTLTLNRSWFKTDGYRQERCGICHGTGKSAYRATAYASEQRQMREKAKAFNDATRNATQEANPNV